MAKERIDAMARTELAAVIASPAAPHQRQLPLPWNLARSGDDRGFAHPAEVELGRILTFYGIRWVYEPTNFVLRWTPDGRPAESFTPDFYLPAQRLYIELTTMRQPLVTRKNRKLRRLRELFPGIRIKLLYRRDVERLFRAYDEQIALPDVDELGQVIADEAEIERRIVALVDQIQSDGFGSVTDDEDDGPLTLLTFEPGHHPFRDRLVAELDRRGSRVNLAEGQLSRYGHRTKRKMAGFVRTPAVDLARRRVLVVTNIVSTGLSAGFVLNWVARQGARSVELCTLLDRPEARLVDVTPRYTAFIAPNARLAGFGLGRHPTLTELPFIAAVEPS